MSLKQLICPTVHQQYFLHPLFRAPSSIATAPLSTFEAKVKAWTEYKRWKKGNFATVFIIKSYQRDTKVVCVCFLLKREKLVGKKDERTTNEKRFFHPQKTILQKLCYCTAFLKRESLFYAVVKKRRKMLIFIKQDNSSKLVTLLSESEMARNPLIPTLLKPLVQ